MTFKCAVKAYVDKKQSSSEHSSVEIKTKRRWFFRAARRTCCWEPGVLGLMLSVLVRGWNVV